IDDLQPDGPQTRVCNKRTRGLQSLVGMWDGPCRLFFGKKRLCKLRIHSKCLSRLPRFAVLVFGESSECLIELLLLCVDHDEERAGSLRTLGRAIVLRQISAKCPRCPIE